MSLRRYLECRSEAFENIPFALNDGNLIHADEYLGGKLKCPGCSQALYFRKRHKRKLSHMVCNVRCTFVHANKTLCETYEHKTAKKIIASTLPSWTFIVSECTCCSTVQTLQYDHSGVEEVAYGPFRLDVGVLQSTRIVGCVEIYKSHRVDPEKKHYLNLRIPWVEVRAFDVLQNFHNEHYTLESLHKKNIVCSSCEERKREEAERNLMHYEESRTQEVCEIMKLRKSTPVLTFGKHKGQSVIELGSDFLHFELKDWWYLRYLAGYAHSRFYTNHFPIPRDIRAEAQRQLKGSCIICEEECDDWKTLCTDCWRIHRNKCCRCGRYVKNAYTFCWNCNKMIRSSS